MVPDGLEVTPARGQHRLVQNRRQDQKQDDVRLDGTCGSEGRKPSAAPPQTSVIECGNRRGRASQPRAAAQSRSSNPKCGRSIYAIRRLLPWSGCRLMLMTTKRGLARPAGQVQPPLPRKPVSANSIGASTDSRSKSCARTRCGCSVQPEGSGIHRGRRSSIRRGSWYHCRKSSSRGRRAGRKRDH